MSDPNDPIHAAKRREIFRSWLRSAGGITADDKLHAVYDGYETEQMRRADREREKCRKAWREYCEANGLDPEK
ncbi:MAG: hypothetical protein AAB389_01960 [Patescibacteria group bacterium]